MKTTHLLLTGIAALTLAGLGACSDDAETAAATSAATSSSSSSTTGGGEGGSGGGEGGSGGSGGAACEVNDDCSVSFADDIHDAWLADAAVGACGTAGCHDAASAEGDFTYPEAAAAAHASLLAYMASDGKYVVPCDTAASQILCNMNTVTDPNPHGECGIPMPFILGNGGGLPAQVTDDQLEALETWIECGAPNN